MGVGGQRHTPTTFPSGKRNGTHYIGSCVDPRVGLDVCGRSRPLPVFDPRTVHPVPSRYTNWATPAYILNIGGAVAVLTLESFFLCVPEDEIFPKITFRLIQLAELVDYCFF